MLNDFIKNKWINFISDNKYKKYFMSNEDIWDLKLNRTKFYIDEHNERPSKKSKNNDIQQLANWIYEQQATYKKNKSIMKNIVIRKKWEDFILDDKYKKYFISNEDEWNSKLNVIKNYIDKYNKRPSKNDKNILIQKLGNWISEQQTSYKNNRNMMKKINLKEKWENFISDEKYKKYFISNHEDWKLKLDETKKYIDKYKKRPVEYDKNIEIKKLAKWLHHQIYNYKKFNGIMNNENIRKEWEIFLADNKYKNLFNQK